MYALDLGDRRRIATHPKAPASVYGERIVEGYRIWDPFRSKLGALLLKSHRSDLGLSPASRVLYLGAATGTTVSHVSDMVSLVYAVEFSPRSMRDLLRLCESRDNIVPLLEDASRPESYGAFLEPVDLVYQDVAQRNQAEIASRNVARYLKPGGILILMVKTRSVDVTRPPKEVLNAELGRLEGADLLEVVDLRPYHQDHWAVVAKKSR